MRDFSDLLGYYLPNDSKDFEHWFIYQVCSPIYNMSYKEMILNRAKVVGDKRGMPLSIGEVLLSFPYELLPSLDEALVKSKSQYTFVKDNGKYTLRSLSHEGKSIHILSIMVTIKVCALLLHVDRNLHYTNTDSRGWQMQFVRELEWLHKQQPEIQKVTPLCSSDNYSDKQLNTILAICFDFLSVLAPRMMANSSQLSNSHDISKAFDQVIGEVKDSTFADRDKKVKSLENLKRKLTKNKDDMS